MITLLVIMGEGHRKNTTLLANIEEGYFPALQMSQELQEILTLTQRGFEDAVSFADEIILKINDKQRDAFLSRITRENNNPVVDRDVLNAISEEFQEYYTLTRDTTQKMITGSTEEQLFEDLRRMATARTMISERLKEGVKIRQEKMADVLSKTRKEYQTGLAIFLFATCVALAIMGIVSIWMVKTLSKPLDKLTAAARQIAKGDLTLNVPVESDDELGQLATSFNLMMGSFRGIMQGIRDAGLQINISASEINLGANQQAEGAAEQSSTVTEVSTTIEELSQTAGRIAENAQDVAQSAEETLKGMKGIKTNVDLVTKKILALGEKSQSIGNITKLIDEMSDRINLLALNAAIEAARAGEAGRGFAVVAAEVGKLAERSVESTSDIRQLIHEIQSEMNATIMSVEETTKWSDKGLEMVSDTAQVVKEISVATQQQKSAAEQVVEAMSDIDRVTRSFATTTKQTALNAKRLTELSTQLKSDISDFNLGATS